MLMLPSPARRERRSFAAALPITMTITMVMVMATIAAATAATTLPPATFQLSVADQQRLQITTAALRRGEQIPQRRGYAQVLDATQFITLVSDWQSATAAAEASSSAAKRLTLLHQDEDNASLKSVQAAHALSAADQAKARALSARIALEWSPGLAQTAAALAQRLSDGPMVLLRVEFAGNVALASGSELLLTEPGNAGQHWSARILGKASGVQVIGPAAAFLAQAAAPELHTGRRLLASAPAGAALSGSILPATAVVTFALQRWCFEKTGAESFVRRLVPPDAAAFGQGYLVAADFTSHAIVIDGASLLLAAQRATSTAPSSPDAADAADN